jgi:hypothetical protein
MHFKSSITQLAIVITVMKSFIPGLLCGFLTVATKTPRLQVFAYHINNQNELSI